MAFTCSSRKSTHHRRLSRKAPSGTSVGTRRTRARIWKRFRAMKLEVVPLYADPENHVIDISSDALPNFPTTAKLREMQAQGTQPTLVAGFQYLRGPDGAMIENAGNFPPNEYFNHVHLFHEQPG